MKHGNFEEDLDRTVDYLEVMFKTFGYWHHLDSAEAYDVMVIFQDALSDAYNKYGGELDG